MEVYTMDRWKADRTFKADLGQEIAEDVYNEMFNCMPPQKLPREKILQVLHDYDLPIHAGFLMGEPASHDQNGPLFLAFGYNDFGKGRHYYYLGLSGPVRKLNGKYYYMHCMNAFVNNGLFPEREFANDAAAIRTAADYEATLYKYEYKNGKRINSQILYEPRFT